LVGQQERQLVLMHLRHVACRRGVLDLVHQFQALELQLQLQLLSRHE
jgi:hypothetical protein